MAKQCVEGHISDIEKQEIAEEVLRRALVCSSNAVPNPQNYIFFAPNYCIGTKYDYCDPQIKGR